MNPNNENTIFHNYLAIGQCKSKWSIAPHPSYTSNTNPSPTTLHFGKLSVVKIFPKAAVNILTFSDSDKNYVAMFLSLKSLKF